MSTHVKPKTRSTDTPGFALPPLPYAEVHARVLAQLQKMTPEEIFQTSVRSGIHTPDGRLTEHYAPRPDDEHAAEMAPMTHTKGPVIIEDLVHIRVDIGYRKGYAQGLREVLVETLSERGVALTTSQRQRLEACDDPALLKRWIGHAARRDDPAVWLDEPSNGPDARVPSMGDGEGVASDEVHREVMEWIHNASPEEVLHSCAGLYNPDDVRPTSATNEPDTSIDDE